MAVQYKDYYETLGVARDASDADIKKAFRRLAREYHPDVAKDKKKAEEKFKEINEAYEVLSNPENRKKYDQLGANWRAGSDFQTPPNWEEMRGSRQYRRPGPGSADFEFQFGGTGFSDFFEQVFGARAAAGRGPGPAFSEEAFAERGRDVEGDILVTLDEVMNGSVRSVTLKHSGTATTHQVRIPPGIAEGQKLRIAGRGAPGSAGGGAGDLFLRVRIASHPDFRVDGHNLIHELDVAPWEAVLGTEVSVPTLTGRVNIKVPPGTQNGQKLRMRGRGLPQREGGNGDLMVGIRIDVPQNVSDEERKLWEQLARESSFKPRS
jgi:curved DNA-binding protein